MEKSLAEVVFELADADAKLDDDARYTVLAAFGGRQELRDHLDLPPTGRTGVTALPTLPGKEPTGAFVTSIGVAGFRGIGAEAVLALHPAPGLTVVSGRNGSGKPSFAEAFEFAITLGSYRWRKKSAQWTGNWHGVERFERCLPSPRLRVDADRRRDATSVSTGDVAAVSHCSPGAMKRRVGGDRAAVRGG